MPPLTALLFETGAKVALLLAVFALAGLCCRGAAKSRHAFQITALTLSLLLPVCMLLLPRWQILDVTWFTSQSGSVVEVARSERASGGAFVVWLWFAGFAALMIRELFIQASLVRWVRRAPVELSSAWRTAVDAVAQEFPKLRRVTVLESADVSSPCTWGVVHPVLLLPNVGRTWSENERRLALVHELAHIRRFDCLSDLIGRFACAVHWYNPLAWWTAAQARRLQAQACDDQVLLSGARASDYALFLVSLGTQSITVRGAAGMAGVSPLGGRVRALLQATVRRADANPWRNLSMLGALGAAAIVLASVSPLARAQSAPTMGGEAAQRGASSAPVQVAPARQSAGAVRRLARPRVQRLRSVPTLSTVPALPVLPPVAEPMAFIPATPPTAVIAPVAATPPTPASQRRPRGEPGAHPP